MLSPFLSAVIMGRDEQDTVARCIDSLAGVVDEIVFLDTGSTDRTVDLAHSHAHNAAPLVRIRHWEWQDDFSAARNEAASHATGKWILSIDCDEWLEGDLTRPGLLKKELQDFEREALESKGKPVGWPRLFGKVPLFDVDPVTREKLSLSHHIRLYPRHPEIRYESPIHNRLVLTGSLEGQGVALLTFRSDQLCFHHTGYDPAHVARKKKHERTARLLAKALAENRDGLNLYYLGRAKHQLGAFEEAIAALEEARDWFLEDPSSHEFPRVLGVWLYLIQAMGDAHREAEAIKQEAATALRFFPHSPDLWYEAGRAMMQVNEPLAAKGAFAQAEGLFPMAEDNEASFLPYKAWELYQNQASVFAALEDVESGRLALEKAVAAGSPLADSIRRLLNAQKVHGVHAGVATVPERVEALAIMVRGILPQVDRLTVYLDRWEGAVPRFLDDDRIEVVQTPEGRRDAGKFAGALSPEWRYFLTLDDDIMYPPDYVQRMVQKLEQYPDAVVGVHGSVLRHPVHSYMRDRDVYHFSSEVGADREVDVLGTGTMAFGRDVPVGMLGQNLVPGMTDVSVSVALARWKKKRVLIERPGGWLLALAPPSPTLFSEGMLDDTEQTALIKQTDWR